MLRNVYTLPQLTVEAKIVFLLMVMICGAVPTTRSVLLKNECSERFMNVYPGHKRVVTAIEDDPDSRYANFTVRTLNSKLEIEIYSPATKKYLCFNHRWKLIATRNKANRHCRFKHDIVINGYDKYVSADNKHMYIGFNERGKPLNANMTMALERNQNSSIKQKKRFKQKRKCFLFTKIDKSVNVNKHNENLNQHNRPL